MSACVINSEAVEINGFLQIFFFTVHASCVRASIFLNTSMPKKCSFCYKQCLPQIALFFCILGHCTTYVFY